MHRLGSLWLNLLGSLWFVPGVLVLAGVGAALLLVELHPLIDLDLAQDWPRLFGAGAEGARGMLSAIATSMITVAGVVFSVTIVALSLTASQYSPRVLRNFMSDRSTQVVLGAFVAVFAYCLIVLRTIRGGDEGSFVPSLAVLGGVFMAFVGIGLLIYFVHHVATAIQVDHILKRIATDTREAIDRPYPAGVGEERPPDPARPKGGWRAALAPCLTVRGERKVYQDAAYGLQQLVDVGLRALSPGVHDPTTAVSCIDHQGALLHHLSNRHIESGLRERDGQLRLIVAVPTYGDLVHQALSALTHHAGSHEPVHERLLAAVEHAAAATDDPERQAALARQLEAHAARLPAADLPTGAVERLRYRSALLRAGLVKHLPATAWAATLPR